MISMKNDNNTTVGRSRYNASSRGFSMIETLVAITMLTLAVTAPLTLAGQGLIAANYAKDQVTAFNLAQEAIELVRFHRDNQLIAIGRGTSSADWLTNIKDSSSNSSLVQEGSDPVAAPPIPFRVDTVTGEMRSCTSACPVLILDSATGIYSYLSGSGRANSRFTRTVYVNRRGTTAPQNGDALVKAIVSWQSGGYGTTRTVSIEDELYQWVPSQN
jgi:type II secretory pathway pseudopilin PulG